ncbi:MAG: PepSY domain-containing protein [Saprospiraceae bacterium]
MEDLFGYLEQSKRVDFGNQKSSSITAELQEVAQIYRPVSGVFHPGQQPYRHPFILEKEFDILQPPTQKGAAKSLNDWLTVEEIASLSLKGFQSKYPETNPVIDRIDVRPSKGIAKVLLENGFWEIQIDGQSGEIYSISRRHSDWIEQLHDGSIIAEWFKWLSMNYLGFGLIVMIITGTWLWWGPKRIRNLKLKS